MLGFGGGCVFILSPVRVGALLLEVPGTPILASFFEFELKPSGKDSADPTKHEFQHHILGKPSQENPPEIYRSFTNIYPSFS